MASFEKMTLENVGDGALKTLFDEARKKIETDLQDLTKIDDGKRKITLTVEITPNTETAALAIRCASKVELAKRKAIPSFANVDARGELVQYTSLEEPTLPGMDNVTKIPARDEAGEGGKR